MRWLCSLLLLPSFVSGLQYEIADLGTFEMVESLAADINDAGRVCGLYRTVEGERDPSLFIWNEEDGFEPQTIVCGQEPPRINGQGQVGGILLTRRLIGLVSTYQPFIFEKKGLKLLELPKDHTQYRTLYFKALTDQGYMLISTARSIEPWERPSEEVFNWVWKHNRFIPVHTELPFYPSDLNDQTLISGASLMIKKQWKAWTPATVDINTQVLLHIPFKYPARCHRMNNEGSWIGTFADSTTKEVHGIYWTKQQGYTVLRHFSPVAFNTHGQIVGYLLKGNQVKAPALWYQGTTHDLNALLKLDQNLSSPWQSLIKVTGINTQGQIVGQGIFGHQVHAYLLNPK